MSMYLAVVASCQGGFTWFDFHIKSCNDLCRCNWCVEGYFDRASWLSLTINSINISNTIIFSIQCFIEVIINGVMDVFEDPITPPIVIFTLGWFRVFFY